MPWYDVFRGRVAQGPAPLPQTPPEALTAAAAEPPGPETKFLRQTEKWQAEVWRFHDTLGEFNYGVGWLANMLSRVRLRAARLQPDTDEPEIVTSGTAADLMMLFGGGVAGQSQIMRRLTVQLSLPGEGYLVGEQDGKRERWQVRSVDEIRVQSGKYQVMDEESAVTGQDWRDLAPEHHVVRVWRPHDRYFHMADSPARSAREVMRELELVNRKIAAEYLSRLASAGLLLLPDELSFPVREEFEEEDNPLMAEWIAIAAAAIENPGTASAVVPIPLVGPAEAIEKVKHVDFTLKIDDKVIERRDSAIKRLATKLDMPAEILLGMGDVNHWGAWQLEESGLKTHIAPIAELICDALTRGYLQPRLEASGEDPEAWVVWYDMSELALSPDRSGNATLAYDRLEISGAAYRRELGFDEDDKPSDEELKVQALKVIIKTLPSGAASALAQLIGEDVPQIVPVSPQDPGTAEAVQQGDTPPPEGSQSAEGAAPARSAPGEEPPPATQDQTGPPEPQRATAERAQRLVQQARTQHMLRVGAAGRWDLLHPALCGEHEYSCPFTHAVATAAPSVRPGGSGTYLCHLDAFGRLVLDGRSPYADTTAMISTSLVPRAVNGHAPAH
ncbi:phage portal protein [Streptomyces africanus]|uniref:phage portal protein n=1 Tax=Streptomyces africanus TaxID=231024 RepID=UPI000A3B6153|nr:phage portal protein [Streptomyces africanus]